MSSRELLILSVFTFLTVLFWIVFSVYHTATTSTLTPIQIKQIEPADSNLDIKTIERLKSRRAH